jgi:hypothetical protein
VFKVCPHTQQVQWFETKVNTGFDLLGYTAKTKLLGNKGLDRLSVSICLNLHYSEAKRDVWTACLEPQACQWMQL